MLIRAKPQLFVIAFIFIDDVKVAEILTLVIIDQFWSWMGSYSTRLESSFWSIHSDQWESYIAFHGKVARNEESSLNHCWERQTVCLLTYHYTKWKSKYIINVIPFNRLKQLKYNFVKIIVIWIIIYIENIINIDS